MCVITDENNKVISVSLIPGVRPIPAYLRVYFPVTGDIPSVGETWIPNENDTYAHKIHQEYESRELEG